MDRSANSWWPGRLGEKERGVGGDPEAWRFGGLHERWARGVGGAEVGAGVERRAGGEVPAQCTRLTYRDVGVIRLIPIFLKLNKKKNTAISVTHVRPVSRQS